MILEMHDRNETRAYREYTDSRLQNEYDELEEKRDILAHDFHGVGMSDSVRVEYDSIEERLASIESEQDRRPSEAETSFTDNDDGKTVTIARGGVSVEVPGVDIPPAPGKHDVATFRRMRTRDKKTFLRNILGVEVRVGDGSHSKELLEKLNVNPGDGSAKFDGTRIFVKRGRGTSLTEDKKMQPKVEEFKELLGKAEDERGLPTVDLTNAPRDSIRGLTGLENRELAGVVNPGPSTIRRSRIGDNGALQIQVDYLQESIDATNDVIDRGDVGSIQEFELREREVGLEEARDGTINQREREEVRERHAGG